MNTKQKTTMALAVLLTIGMIALGLFAQNPAVPGTTPVQLQTSYYPLTAISATGAVNVSTTLTIPAPVVSGYYNYVCRLAFQANNDNTATAGTNVVSTSTNFNSFAVKLSFPSAASNDTGVIVVLDGQPGTGCAKSISPTTATTFVSPASLTHEMWTWYATYFQAP